MYRAFLTAVAACLLSFGAQAQGVATEIERYSNIRVTFSQSAERCNLKDPAIFEERLAASLGKVTPQNSESALTANLGISGTVFGPLSSQCTYHVRLSFLAVLTKDNLTNIPEQAMEAIERLQEVQVVLYEVGVIGTEVMRQPNAGGPAIGPRDAVFKGIDLLVARFEKDHKGM